MRARLAAFWVRARWVLIPVLLGAIVWGPSLRGDFIWDDWFFFGRWMAGNNTLKGVFFPEAGLMGNVPYYKPFAGGSSYLLFVAFGRHPFWWRLATLALHLGTVAALAFLLLRLLRPGEHRKLYAAIGASFFAVWPTSSEAIGWISARGEPLIAFFITCAMILHLRARDRGTRPFGAALLFLCALFSKETAIAFLPIAVAASWLVPPGEDAKETGLRASLKTRLWLPYVLIYVVYAAMRQRALGSHNGIGTIAGGMLRLELLRPALYAWGFYVREALVLGPGEPYLEFIPTGSLSLAFAFFGLVLLAVSGLAMLRASTRLWALPAAWFLLLLGPALAVAGNSNSITPVAIRYLYAPCIGLAILVALAVERMALPSWAPRRAMAIAAVAALAGLFVVDAARIAPWMSEPALWSRALKTRPESVLIHGNLATAAMLRGDQKDALDEFRIAAWAAVPLDDVQKNTALGNLARYYLGRGDLDLARVALLETLKHHGSSSALATSLTAASVLELTKEHNASGMMSAQKLRQALAQLEQAAAVDPFDTTSRRILGVVYEAIAEPVRARHAYREFLKVSSVSEPEQQAVAKRIEVCTKAIEGETSPLKKHYFAAEQADYDGDLAGAVAEYSSAHELEPDRVDLLEALADADARAGNLAAAESLLVRASELSPADPAIWLNLGIYRASQKKYREGAEAFEKASTLAPAWPKPYINAGRVFDLLGDRERAIRNYRAFVEHFEGPHYIAEDVETRIGQLEAAPPAGR